MDMKGSLKPELKDEQWVADLAFMADITKYLSDLNIALQGKSELISTMSDTVESLKLLLLLLQSQLKDGNFDNFPSLKSLTLETYEHIDEYQTQGWQTELNSI